MKPTKHKKILIPVKKRIGLYFLTVNDIIKIMNICSRGDALEEELIRISVREIVEFILRSGDIDNRYGGHTDANAMQNGSRLHRKIQKAAGATYRAEVSLKKTVPVEQEGETFILQVEGRADGIFEEGLTYIDEIKTTFRDVTQFEEMIPVHRAQAMCYAYMYADGNSLERIGIRLTYCNIDTEEIKYFTELFGYEELKKWFDNLTGEYSRWAARDIKWTRERNESILKASFPFPYREGQRNFVSGVYKSIEAGRNIFVEAPTGAGKTMATVFPSVWSLGEGKAKKIFYGTAKTIVRTVAEEAFNILIDNGMKFRFVTITAKEKICVLDKPECNPDACPRAKGHFDRVNTAVFDMLTSETRIDRKTIEDYALKHNVCPFEMCLDVSTWADAIICDYNYLFDPRVHLKRFFDAEATKAYIFLIDEAHNLVDRAGTMFSATVIKEDFLKAKAALGTSHKRLSSALMACSRELLSFKRATDGFQVFEDTGGLVLKLMRFVGLYEDESRFLTPQQSEEIVDAYFASRHFLAMSDLAEDDYRIYGETRTDASFALTLRCMNPAANLRRSLLVVRSAVFFSATMLPIDYYRDQLGGSREDYCMYAVSPFDRDKRLLMIGDDVTTEYKRRSEDNNRKIIRYIHDFTHARTGNYLVFFPSYRMLSDIADGYTELFADESQTRLLVQSQNMDEVQREEFLNSLTETPTETVVGFCVMGGVFSEGIDLKHDRLIGAVIVGTGLPQVCDERELFRNYYDESNGRGFEYAYLFNGMNKVEQAAGRVIRTAEDTGAILLLDDRFFRRQYLELFPREWDNYRRVTVDTIAGELQHFWDSVDGG